MLNTLRRDYLVKATGRQSNWDTRVFEQKTKAPNLMTCPGCQVALVCSKEHLDYLHKDGHKRCCGLPPFRLPFNEEDNRLCREIFGSDKKEAETGLLDYYEDDDGDAEQEDDDDGSWESIDSSDEAALSKTQIIHSFFMAKSYKLQQRELPPFANFF